MNLSEVTYPRDTKNRVQNLSSRKPAGRPSPSLGGANPQC